MGAILTSLIPTCAACGSRRDRRRGVSRPRARPGTEIRDERRGVPAHRHLARPAPRHRHEDRLHRAQPASCPASSAGALECRRATTGSRLRARQPVEIGWLRSSRPVSWCSPPASRKATLTVKTVQPLAVSADGSEPGYTVQNPVRRGADRFEVLPPRPRYIVSPTGWTLPVRSFPVKRRITEDRRHRRRRGDLGGPTGGDRRAARCAPCRRWRVGTAVRAG